MVFTSVIFTLVFLPLLLLVYFLVSPRLKNILLLVFSLLFYAWGEPKYVFLMIASIIMNYSFGLWIHRLPQYKRHLLIVGIAINIGILFYFKYLGFAISIIGQMTDVHFEYIANIIMPIGISFYTFQSISYLVDVYRDNHLVQKNLMNLGLYITFFPQLIAGPIIRYRDISQQIYKRDHSLTMFADGIQRFIIGFSKKIIIANTLADVADQIFAFSFEMYGTYYAWLAIVAYTLQIYYDFSGYSDMAIGLGRMFGFSFLENFNYPYVAKSMTDFWRRWHISLSNWFKDYLYIPIGGNKCGVWNNYRNLYIVFFLTGLWHGASFNFIIWGLGHGTLLVVEKYINRLNIVNKPWHAYAMSIYTMLSIMLLWVFFRVEGVGDSVAFILKLFGVNYYSIVGGGKSFANSTMLDSIVHKQFYLTLILGVVFATPWWRNIIQIKKIGDNIIIGAKYIALIALFIVSLSYLAANSYNPFIYFRF